MLEYLYISTVIGVYVIEKNIGGIDRSNLVFLRVSIEIRIKIRFLVFYRVYQILA